MNSCFVLHHKVLSIKAARLVVKAALKAFLTTKTFELEACDFNFAFRNII